MEQQAAPTQTEQVPTYQPDVPTSVATSGGVPVTTVPITESTTIAPTQESSMLRQAPPMMSTPPQPVQQVPVQVPISTVPESESGLLNLPILDVSAPVPTSTPIEETSAIPTYQQPMGGTTVMPMGLPVSVPTYYSQPEQALPAQSTVPSPPLGPAAGPTPTQPSIGTGVGVGVGAGAASQPIDSEIGHGRSSRVLPAEITGNIALRNLAQSNPEIAQMMEYEVTQGTTPVPGTQGGDAGVTTTPEGKYVDITDYLNMPQTRVAKTLGIPSSTLSKRWREAARQRKWPWRTVCKIDKEIMALLHNVPSGTIVYKGHGQPDTIPPEIQTRLVALLRQRQDELKPVVIRL